MRKVLSFVLVLSLVLGSLGMAFAAPLSDVADEDCEEAVNVLTQLDVVKGYPDGSYKPENIVTRAEMAVIVVSALGLADYATGTSSFKDMAGHWSNGFVAYATSLGIISGYPDGTFKPDATVSYDEAATMLVAALGYTPDALVGTWPANYVTKAKTLGILDGIKSGVGGANRGDIAIMAYQTLDQNLGKTDKDGVWAPTVLKIDNTTSPATYTYDNMLGRLDVEEVAGGAFVVTGGEDSLINLKPYVGAYVKAYESDGDIIAIKEVKSTFLTGEVKAVSSGIITKFKADGVEYNVDNVGYEVNKAPVVAKEFKNGKDVTSTPPVYTNRVAGDDLTLAVKVSGKYIKEVYSISEWEVTRNAKVGTNDLKDIDGKTPKLLGEKFALDDNDKIDLTSFALFGVKTLADIEKDNIVYVYINSDKEISRIEVGTEVVKGEVTKIKGDKYTIDGKEYELVDNAVYDNATSDKPKIDSEIEAYLDYAGDIYSYKIIHGTADKIGIILSTGDAGSGTGLDAKDTRVKLFLADGTNKTFVVDEDVYETSGVSGLLSTGGNWISPATNLIGVAVKYDINKDGDISALEEIAFEKALTTTSTGDSSKLFKNGTFKGYEVNSDALIISYKDTNSSSGAASGKLPFVSKAADYDVTTLDKLLGSDIEFAYYTLDSNKIDFLYISSTSTAADSVYGVLVDAEKNNTDAGWGVDLLIDGEEVYKDADKDYRSASTYSRQDLYEVSYDSAGAAKLGAHGLTAVTIDAGDTRSVSGRVVSYPAGGTYTIASDAIIYVWNEDDGAYEVGSSRDIYDGTPEVLLYDADEGTSDADEIYDIVLVIGDAIDNTAPTVIDTIVVNATTINLVFNEKLDSATFTAGVKNGFDVTTGTLTKAELKADGVTVVLTGTGFTASTVVSYTAGSIKDLAGNSLATF